MNSGSWELNCSKVRHQPPIHSTPPPKSVPNNYNTEAQQITNNKQGTTYTKHTFDGYPFWYMSVCVWSKGEFYRCRALFGGNLFSGPLIYWHPRANALNISPSFPPLAKSPRVGWMLWPVARMIPFLGPHSMWFFCRLAIQITLIEFHFYTGLLLFCCVINGPPTPLVD